MLMIKAVLSVTGDMTVVVTELGLELGWACDWGWVWDSLHSFFSSLWGLSPLSLFLFKLVEVSTCCCCCCLVLGRVGFPPFMVTWVHPSLSGWSPGSRSDLVAVVAVDLVVFWGQDHAKWPNYLQAQQRVSCPQWLSSYFDPNRLWYERWPGSPLYSGIYLLCSHHVLSQLPILLAKLLPRRHNC